MIYNYWWQISTDNLSNLDSSTKFSSSSYNLSLRIQNLATVGQSPKRFYSTSSINGVEAPVLSQVGNIDKYESIKFDSLEQASEQIKFKYLGVSGVYKLTSKIDKSRFYIGSSNNLSRRIEEYNKLTKGLRNPNSASELEISKTSALNWSLEFIYITTPQTSLVFEQYAIIKLKPTINSNYKVIPRVNPQRGNLDNAILTIENLLALFSKGSEGYDRFAAFLKIFKTANSLNYTPEDVDNKYYSFLLFVYDVCSPDKDPIVYSSINRALKGLQISHSTLLNHVNNKYFFKSNLILSFEPLFVENFSEYSEKLTGDNQLRKHVVVYNKDNEVVIEFKSAREMAKYFQIDGKVARAAIAQGEYQDFLLLSKEISYRKTIYVFDSNSHELIVELKSITKALKYAKVNYYTLKSLIENGNSYDGKIYSYKDKL
uniref:GIY-YIG endonuclease n=1 Tax=Chrysoporthe austroafricana TaxID=354353 RepID=A0A191MWM8_9PEZI|nr:GIY-YIG endonuclease [Chrysoporthe austroafricana]AMX22076.1 GIY-YIG endonuclease [Chrysoporthe austroafricana]